jgi:hypothetical protein
MEEATMRKGLAFVLTVALLASLQLQVPRWRLMNER